MHCVLCAMCSVCCVLCAVLCAVCCAMHCALCVVCCALCACSCHRRVLFSCGLGGAHTTTLSLKIVEDLERIESSIKSSASGRVVGEQVGTKCGAPRMFKCWVSLWIMSIYWQSNRLQAVKAYMCIESGSSNFFCIAQNTFDRPPSFWTFGRFFWRTRRQIGLIWDWIIYGIDIRELYQIYLGVGDIIEKIIQKTE